MTHPYNHSAEVQLLGPQGDGPVTRTLVFRGAMGSLVPEELAEQQPPSPPSLDLRAELLAGVATDVAHTNRVFDIINLNRSRGNRLPILAPEAYHERLQDQLTPNALSAAEQLHRTEESPLMVLPTLPVPITAEEMLMSLHATSKRGFAVSPLHSMHLLERFKINDLSGYDEARAAVGAMAIVSAAYDQRLEGTAVEQMQELEKLKANYPELDVAALFVAASLAQRCNASRNRGRENLVRAINLAPVHIEAAGKSVDCVLTAKSDEWASVSASNVAGAEASRRIVKLAA